jgi:hypothetical protein
MFSFYFIMKSDKIRGFHSKPGWKVERGVRFALKIWTVGVRTGPIYMDTGKRPKTKTGK